MIKHLSLVLGWLMISGLAHATSPDSLKTFTLPKVRVVIDKPSEAIGQLQKVIIADKSEAMNLRAALQNNVGTSVSVGSKDESNLRLRGFRKNEVKVMIDGRPINNGYFGNVDISKLSIIGISEMQIVKGPSSPLFGSGSMGGVLNLVSTEPNAKKWLKIGTTIKRNNTNSIQLSSSHIFDTWSYKLGISGLSSDGFMLSEKFKPTFSENGSIRNHSGKEQYNLYAGWNTELFSFHKLGFDILYSGMKRKEIPSSIYERKTRLYKDWARYNAGLTSEFRLNEAATLSTLISYDGGGDRYLEYNDAAMQNLNVDSRMDNGSWGFAPKLRLQRQTGETIDFGYKLDIQENKRKDNGNYKTWTYSHVLNQNAFFQYDRELIERLKITGGIGFSAYSYAKKTATTFITEPSLGLNYNGGSMGISNFAIGMNSAPHTMHQLYSIGKGNSELIPQRSLKLEISHSTHLLYNHLALNAALFYNDSRDLIDLKMGKYENIYRLVSEGAELGMVFSLNRRYQIEASYAYLEYDKNSDYRLTETPKHSLELVNRFSLPGDFLVSLSSSYRGNRLSQDEIGTYYTLESYWKHDIQLHYAWKSLGFSAGLENILDVDYQGEYGFPEAGRDFNLGIELSL